LINKVPYILVTRVCVRLLLYRIKWVCFNWFIDTIK